MLTNLREINRVLSGVDVLGTDEGAPIDNVVEYCSSVVLEGSIVNHHDTIDFCMQVGLLRRQRDRIVMSDLGDRFWFYNKERKFVLNSKQKNLLAMSCFLKGKLSKEVQQILVQFQPDHKKMTFIWSPEIGNRLQGDTNLINLLLQSEVLFRSSDMFMVNPEYSYIVSSFKASNKLTIEELDERLAEHNEVGKVAEKLAVDFERKRLQDAGYNIESERVLNISDIDVAAGYDVMSFDAASIDYDRFIEVKGSKYENIAFVMSRNEIEKARELGPKYWLYFISGVDLETKTAKNTTVFQDPASSILDSDDFDQDCLKVQIKEKAQNITS